MGREAGRLSRMLYGFFETSVVVAVTRLGLPDLLARKPLTLADLTTALGAHEDSLRRLLRAALHLELVALDGDRFTVTERGGHLRADAPNSIRNLVLMFGSQAPLRAWAELDHTVRTGETAFDHVHGMNAFDYLAAHPEESAVFNAAMGEATTYLTAAPDLGSARTVVDVGGGNGTLMASMLSRDKGLHGIVFDRPEGLTRTREVLDAAGVADRCELVGGDFFDAVPSGHDAYVLKSVLHDWDDEKCVAILRTTAAAMPRDGRILVVEDLLPESFEESSRSVLPVINDLTMLVWMGGKQRTEQEFRVLAARAGLALRECVPFGASSSVLRLEHARPGWNVSAETPGE